MLQNLRPPRAFLMLAPLVLVSGRPGESVGYAPKEGSVLAKKVVIESAITLEEMSFEVNGQDMSQAAQVEMSAEISVALGVTDRYTAMLPGRPAKLERTFDEVSSKTHVSGSNPMGEQDIEIPGSSELEGLTVAFAWDEDEEGYTASFAEDGDGDEKLLEDLAEDMDLRGFLPGKEVAMGDTWAVPTSAVKAALAPGGSIKIEPEADDERFGQMGGVDQFSLHDLVNNLEGDFQAEYAGVREEEGVRVAVIKLKLEGHSAEDMTEKTAEQIKDNLPPGVEMELESVDLEFSLDTEGELLWDLEAGHFHSLELSGDSKIIADTAMTVQVGEQDQQMENSMTFGGTQTLSMTISGS